MLVEYVLQQFGLQQTSLFGNRAADALNLIAKINRRKFIWEEYKYLLPQCINMIVSL